MSAEIKYFRKPGYGQSYAIMPNGENVYEGKYAVFKWGLLWIVKELYYEFDPIWTEDSRWEDKEKAKEHCRILNERI